MDWSNKTPISEMRFGSSWEPRLIDFMKQHPWPDSDFHYGAPVFTYTPPKERPDNFDEAADRDAWLAAFESLAIPANTEADKALRFEQWKKMKAEFPTNEARAAWDREHASKLGKLRNLLSGCGVKVADDIIALGCTGCIVSGLSIDDIKFLRIGLAGGGVGLPCFVPPNMYCLAHEVSGGLQEGQQARYPEAIQNLARPLTAEETSQGKLVEAAQVSDTQRDAHLALRGRKLPEGWEKTVDEIRADGGVDDFLASRRSPEERVEALRQQLFPWKCPEHDKTNWACRYCVAQAVVEGEIVPTYAIRPETNGFTKTGVSAFEAAAEIEYLDAAGARSVGLWARVATFTRKLSRD
jgi:hypothetical protein